MDRIGVAVIGLGIGRQHLDALAALPDQFRIEAVCDLDTTRLAELAERHAVPHASADLAAVLADDRVELVSICTPPHLHRAQIGAALAAGKAVVCEKPLVASLAECAEVRAASAASGLPVFPIFQSRFGHGLAQLKHLQAQGLARHAHLATVETHWRRETDYYAAAPWRGTWAGERGGVCLTQAIHAHDMLTQVLGPVAGVFAHLATRVNDVEVEDCAAISLVMASGAVASLSATLGAAENLSRLRFVFDDLTATSDSPNPYRPAQAPWHFKARNAATEAAIAEALRAWVPGPEGFVAQFAAIHATLRGGAPAPVTLAEAQAALELVAAAYHSASTLTHVRLPLTPGHRAWQDWAPPGRAFPKRLQAR
jgi:predicted dehydrogenase